VPALLPLVAAADVVVVAADVVAADVVVVHKEVFEFRESEPHVFPT